MPYTHVPNSLVPLSTEDSVARSSLESILAETQVLGDILTATANLVSMAATVASILDSMPARPDETSVCQLFTVSGDNPVLAVQESLKTCITYFKVQNEGTTDTTVLIKVGGVTVDRIPCPAKADGAIWIYPVKGEWIIPPGSALAVNLSTTSSISVSLRYFLQA